MQKKQTKWQTVGHAAAKRIFEAQLISQSLSHAYLLIGPAGVGKRMLAREFAHAITSESSHDITVIDIVETGDADSVRELLRHASLTPLQHEKKVVVLENVETISAAAANMILKTLEEPPEHTIFILVSNAVRILPTIMSRCQIIRCSRLTMDELRAYAAQQVIHPTETQLAMAAGTISKLAAPPRSEEWMEQIETAIRQGSFEQMQLVKSLAELEDAELKEILADWLHMQVASLRTDPARYRTVQTVVEAMQRLQKNLNKKMVLEFFVANTTL